MLVSFKFECKKHGEFDHYFNSAQYPTRDFPFNTVICPVCNTLSTYIPFSRNMQPDSLWSGKNIDQIGLTNVTSKSYLKRYLRDNNIVQLTSDESLGKMPTQKTFKEKVEHHLNTKEVVEQRQTAIIDAMEKHGVT